MLRFTPKIDIYTPNIYYDEYCGYDSLMIFPYLNEHHFDYLDIGGETVLAYINDKTLLDLYEV